MLTCWDKKRNLQINYKEKKKKQSAFKRKWPLGKKMLAFSPKVWKLLYYHFSTKTKKKKSSLSKSPNLKVFSNLLKFEQKHCNLTKLIKLETFKIIKSFICEECENKNAEKESIESIPSENGQIPPFLEICSKKALFRN